MILKGLVVFLKKQRGNCKLVSLECSRFKKLRLFLTIAYFLLRENRNRRLSGSPAQAWGDISFFRVRQKDRISYADTVSGSNLLLPLYNFVMEKRNANVKKWEAYFKSIGLPNSIISAYIEYITPILEKKIPIIFEISHLGKLLQRQESYITSVAFCSKKHYRTFKIPKKTGGFREISSPYPSLLQCQYWIYDNILSKVPIHGAAQAYTTKKSIITNANLHVGHNAFLKMDLKDFYPSIKRSRIVNFFKSIGYAENVAFFLASLCCKDKCLPQGAPTSPALSNIIAYHLDVRLSKLSEKIGLIYTRYADDLAFSGAEIPSNFIKYVEKIINEEGFEVNHKKTFFQKHARKRILTGISISENTIKVPKEYKRKLRQEIYYIFKYGVFSHMNKNNIKNPYYLKSIAGKINFWLSVEPENEFAKEAKVKVGALIEKFKLNS